MEKENILIVHNYYQLPGGEDTVVKNEKEMLESNGHKVTLYSRNNSELKEFSIFQKMSLPFTFLFNLKTYCDIKQLIRKKDIRIVHVHNTLSLISPAVYYAALSCKIPVIQTLHNFRILCPKAVFYRDGHICEDCMKFGLKCAVKHKCYRDSLIQTLMCVINTKVHRILGIYKKIYYICLTEFNKEKLLHLKQINPTQIFVKPNFIDGFDKIIPYRERKNQFVFAGRIEELKGIDILLRAWDMLGKKAPILLIYGSGPMEKWCKKFISDHELKSVKMKGLIPSEEVRRVMAVSKALILPTRCYEGFPMSILEAYSVGTPAIVSNLGNVSDIVIEGVTGSKFQMGNPDNLVEAVQRLEKYGDIVSLTKIEYEKYYTKTKNYKYITNIYHSIQKNNE